MDDRRISRRQILIGAGALTALSPLLGPVVARADDQGGLVRWDLIAIASAAGTTEVVVGGTDVGRDSATGDTVSLTGSGQANIDEARATGGGTFVGKTSDGTTVVSGVYVVTAFKGFQNFGGSLAPTGLVDGIGQIGATTSGILSVGIHAVATDGRTADGVLEVHCNLPGASPTTEEGVVLTIGPFHFTQDPSNHGFTLFHVIAQ